MLFATLEQARQNPAWHRGDLVITQRGIQHALVRGQGPDVILLHGITDNAHTWNAVQERLAGVARTHALDLPGHGLSDIPGTLPTPPEMADWVAAYMDAARVDSAVISCAPFDGPGSAS
jgi:pimeloyl-ACP methyl ester carboxylesterase